MTTRTVTVHLNARVAAYLKNMKLSEKGTKDLRSEIDKLNGAAHSLTKGGLFAAMAGLPGLLSPAGAAVAALPGLVFTAAGSFGALAMAVHGTGDAMKAVGEGDAEKLREALAGLSAEARRFIAEYERVKPTLDRVADANQDAFFRQFNGSLERLTGQYLPTMLNQMPRVSAELGRAGRELANWAGSPPIVAKINRQLESAAVLTGEWTRLLTSGIDLMLELADSSRDFNKGFVGGLADGAEAMTKWVANARQTGQLNQIFENAQRVMSGLVDVTAKLGVLLFDIMANPALADGALALLNVLGMTLTVVQALLTVFEALPPGIQSTVVTFAVLGGAVLLVTGRVVALKAALDSARLSAVQAGTAVKAVGGVLGGPWGIAIAAGIALTGAFAAKQMEAKAAADGLRDTLDRQTGAVTSATRQQVYNSLAANGAIQLAKEMGLSIEEVTNAAMGGEKAAREFYKALNARQLASGESPGQMSTFILRISETGAAVDSAKQGWADMQTAMGTAGKEIDETTGKVKDQTRALQKLADELRAQTDPVFALIKAQKDVAAAQQDYNEAVKESGRESQAARDASLALAESSVRLTGAVSETAGTFNGQLTPELYAALDAAGLTNKQITDIEKSFLAAAKAGNEFAGTYEVTVKSHQLDEAIAKARQLRNLLGSFAAAVSAGTPDEGRTGRRWGGITEHAREGLLREPKIYSAVRSGARYAFAEPETGGEAFVPRIGNRGRSLSILSQAAGWYGHRLTQASPASMSTPRASGSASPAMSSAAFASAVRSALHGVSVVMDGRAVGQIQARQADLFVRGG